LSVVERLCMIISFIAIKSTNTFWPQSVSEIITFGFVNQKQCFFALLILKNMAVL
jgi:hypothetical protein